MKLRARTVLVTMAALLVLLVLAGLTAIGWEVVLGPKARPVSAQPFEVTAARLERGRYLVEGPAHCFHCHTEHDETQPTLPILQARKGAGAVMPVPELNNIPARNITPDVETGIGSWTDDEIARAIREGVRKDGTALFPMMPYPDFQTLEDEDVASIVVYLRTIPPVNNRVPVRALPFPLEYIVNTIPQPLPTSRATVTRTTAADRGRYLATIAGCAGCHSGFEDDGTPIPGRDFAGGTPFEFPGVPSVVSANITPHASGISHYDEALFIQTLRTGRMGGRLLSHVMPFEFFQHITDDDLRDLFAFLKTVTPVQHRVNNIDPATACAFCGRPHGLGDLNAAPPPRGP